MTPQYSGDTSLIVDWHCHWNSPAQCYYVCDYRDIFAKLMASSDRQNDDGKCL